MSKQPNSVTRRNLLLVSTIYALAKMKTDRAFLSRY